MSDMHDLTADLEAEQDALDRLVSTLPEDQWSQPTPSPGWTIADQIGHLTYFDATAVLAITDAELFGLSVKALRAAADVSALTLGRGTPAPEMLATWRRKRAELITAANDLDTKARLPWYGPPMSARSFITARLMECWAHGQDIRDALGVAPEASDRLRHVAQLGFITRGWSYVNRDLEPPPTAVRVELGAPSGAVWRHGPDDASEVVRGSAVDFCLVVTQRRHVDDTQLEISGPAARDWMEKAQAFAGKATEGPRPRGATA